MGLVLKHELEQVLPIVLNHLLSHVTVNPLVVTRVTHGHRGHVVSHVVQVSKQEVGHVVLVKGVRMNLIQGNVFNHLVAINVLIGHNGQAVIKHVVMEHEQEHEHVAQNQIVPNKLNQKHVMREHVLVHVRTGPNGEPVRKLAVEEPKQEQEHVRVAHHVVLKQTNKAVL